MPIEKLHQLFLKSTGVCTDTRKIFKGCLFVALKGENFNGNNFAEKAIENGAKYVLIDEEAFFVNAENTILVPNALKALQELAKFHRQQFDIPVIALTGSNGKTTTKELILTALSKKYTTLATEGNLNNHIGVPLTLLNLTTKHAIAVVEMGANHLNEINQLCAIAQPNFGLITNIGNAHIGEFGGYENIVKAKTELFQYLLSSGGFAFINADQEETLQFAKDFDFEKKLTYGQSPFADNLAVPLKQEMFCKLLFNKKEIQTQMIGAYNFSNVLAAISVAKEFDVEEKDIIEAIQNYIPSNNRSEFIETENNKIVLDAYNANPSSIEAALQNFNALRNKNKVVILGEMNELGTYSKEAHKDVLQSVLDRQGIDVGIFIGKKFNGLLDTEFEFFKDTSEAIDYLKTNPLKDKFVLIKGSRTNQLERLIKFL